jgi:hypothetical protein
MKTYRDGLLFGCNVLSSMRDQIGDFSQTNDHDAAMQRALDAARCAIAEEANRLGTSPITNPSGQRVREPELAHCPFCGGEACFEPKNWCGRDYIGVFCKECLIFQDGRSSTNAEAASLWNTRHPAKREAEQATALAMAGNELSGFVFYPIPAAQGIVTEGQDPKGLGERSEAERVGPGPAKQDAPQVSPDTSWLTSPSGEVGD